MPQTYLVESYWAELTNVAVRVRAARVAAAAQQMRAEGRLVTFLGALLIPDDEVCFWRFAGMSIADVEEASRRAQLDVGRIARSVDIAHYTGNANPVGAVAGFDPPPDVADEGDRPSAIRAASSNTDDKATGMRRSPPTTKENL